MNDVPNLDAMSVEELRDFINLHKGAQAFRRMFPKMDSRVCVRVTNMLVEYAKLRIRSIQLRLNGKIPSAMILENDAEYIYATLPECCRW